MKKLQGKRISLRPIEIQDLEAVYRWENNSENWTHSNHLNPFSRFFLEQYILHSENNIYTDRQLRLIIETSGKEPVGLIDLFDFDPHHRRAAVGILVDPVHQRRGYASEALGLVIQYARDTLSVKQLHCGIGEENTHSMRLFQKHGFELTGTRRAWRLDGGKYKDEHFLQLLFS